MLDTKVQLCSEDTGCFAEDMVMLPGNMRRLKGTPDLAFVLIRIVNSQETWQLNVLHVFATLKPAAA